MQPLIVFDAHALVRLHHRANIFGLDFEDARHRSIATIRAGNHAEHKHLSRDHSTYYRYFEDGLSFYVICEPLHHDPIATLMIRTVIIERGRE